MKQNVTRPGVKRIAVFYLFMLLTWMTASSLLGQQNTFTMNFSMMSPHVGQDIWLAVIDTESMTEVGRTHAVGELSFVMEIPGILEDGKSYNVDFFADYNKNGHYDPPGADHAWRLEIIDAQGDETLEFSHQSSFTDVEWKHRLRLAFSGMSANVGQEMVLYVRDQATDSYLDTVIVESIPADEFAMDSYVIGPVGTYTLDFFADLNGNGMYDAPPVDQAWRMVGMETTGDLDLEFTYNQDFTDIFQATGIARDPVRFGVSVYPNPASSFLNISMDPGQGSAANISVLNTAGITILSRTPSGSGTSLGLDIGQLPDGIYIVQVESNSGRSFSRFIKH